METLEAIENRRSIRHYKKEDIKNEIVEDIINCGRLAPSAKNRQPWFFVILKNKMKDNVANLMIEDTLNNHEFIEKNIFKSESSVNPTADTIKQAPILILVFREPSEVWIEGDCLSIGACIENMCLRARELGIGSLWIRDTVYVAESIAEMVGYNHLELNCALALGYTEQFPKMRKRKEMHEIIKWYEE